MKKLTRIIASVLFIALTSVGLLGNPPAFADCSNVCDASCDAAPSVKEAAGCNATTNDALPKVIQNILNVILSISGIIAVIFIVIGGIHYMTSAGDAGKIKKAKDTVLYAVIGLIVCILAFAIVNFVIRYAT